MPYRIRSWPNPSQLSDQGLHGITAVGGCAPWTPAGSRQVTTIIHAHWSSGSSSCVDSVTDAESSGSNCCVCATAVARKQHLASLAPTQQIMGQDWGAAGSSILDELYARVLCEAAPLRDSIRTHCKNAILCPPSRVHCLHKKRKVIAEAVMRASVQFESSPDLWQACQYATGSEVCEGCCCTCRFVCMAVWRAPEGEGACPVCSKGQRRLRVCGCACAALGRLGGEGSTCRVPCCFHCFRGFVLIGARVRVRGCGGAVVSCSMVPWACWLPPLPSLLLP